MGRKEVREHKRLQAKATPAAKDNTGVGGSSAGAAEGSFPGKHQETSQQAAREQLQSPGEARSEAAALKEEFYENDSLGG